jgi:hypothetical protein
MGYTNYWTVANELTLEQKQSMRDFANKVIDNAGIVLGDYQGINQPIINTDEISFNGDDTQNLSHETFCLELTRAEWSFCKTNRKPYDIAVKACLIHAQSIGVVSEWRFDGDISEVEYIEALKLFEKVLS